MIVVVATAVAAAVASPLVVLRGRAARVCRMKLCGIRILRRESVMRAMIASMTMPERRASAFGILNAVFGLAWFFGSVLLVLIS